jgi:hypothetical protein
MIHDMMEGWADGFLYGQDSVRCPSVGAAHWGLIMWADHPNRVCIMYKMQNIDRGTILDICNRDMARPRI